MKTIQAFFWDYDNTLIETADAHWNKHRIVLAKHGIELNEKFGKRLYENNGNQNWEWMTNELGLKVSRNEYLKAIDFEFHQHMKMLKMRPGVNESLKFIHELGIPQAIITNARRGSAEPVLKEKKIISFMHFILCKEDYEGRKPEPTPYLIGMKKMESFLREALDPTRCIAVEDDPKGIESAYRAGLIVIQRKLKADEADHPYANYCCFHSEDFLKIIRFLLKN